MIGAMQPLVFEDPVAIALSDATWLTWLLSELRILYHSRRAGGELLDRGSRVWVVLLVVLGLGAAAIVARAGAGGIGGWWPVAAGLGVAVAGIALRQWAVIELGALFTTTVQIRPGHRVIDTGPYAVVRHPAYSGALLSVVGVSLAMGSWLSVLLATTMATSGIAWRIHVEEAALHSRLGNSWTTFANRRKRLVPKVW